MLMKDEATARALNNLSRQCHAASKEAGWWDQPILMVENLEDGKSPSHYDGRIPYDIWVDMVTPTKLALIHSEVSEAMEGFRKNLMDDHLPHRKMAEVELADALIRIFDLAGAHGFDLGHALMEKFNYNQERADHKRENRQKEGGKKF